MEASLSRLSALSLSAACPALPAPPCSPHVASTAELELLCPRGAARRELSGHAANSAEKLGLQALLGSALLGAALSTAVLSSPVLPLLARHSAW